MRDRHEVLREIIDLYIESDKERIVCLWEKKPKRRKQLYDELFHCIGWFRGSRSTDLDPPLDQPAQVVKLMRHCGVGNTCLVYSSIDYDRDAEVANLDAALTEYVGQQNSVMLFCPTSKTAFCEDHNGSQLLLSLKSPVEFLKGMRAAMAADRAPARTRR